MNKIDELIKDEWRYAQEKYPPYASQHEAASVLREEIEEAEHELKIIRELFDQMWEEGIKTDDDPITKVKLYGLDIRTKMAIKELAQVGAVVERFKNYYENKEV